GPIFVPARLKMIRHQEDQMARATAIEGALKTLLRSPERITAQPGERPSKFCKNAGRVRTPGAVHHGSKSLRMRGRTQPKTGIRCGGALRAGGSHVRYSDKRLLEKGSDPLIQPCNLHSISRGLTPSRSP